ncbi:hypothetical protein E3Q19_02830 [Wallemia mellicola]|nr:hypothetical protein E3Q19_02830 [Wallemia mellicola]
MSKLRKGIVYSVTEWAERHKNDFPKLVKKYDFDPKTFESSIEIAAALPFSIVGSMDSARSVGWDETVDTYTDGYKAYFDKMKESNLLPKYIDLNRFLPTSS